MSLLCSKPSCGSSPHPEYKSKFLRRLTLALQSLQQSGPSSSPHGCLCSSHTDSSLWLNKLGMLLPQGLCTDYSAA